MRKITYLIAILVAFVLVGFLAWTPILSEVLAREGAAAQEEHEGHVENENGEHHKEEYDDHGDADADADAHEHTAVQVDGHENEDQDLKLTVEQRQRFGIAVELAGGRRLRDEISLPGEVVFNEDRVVHLVPRIAGIVRNVTKTVGDSVTAGEILAVIDSRELADAKAEYFAARAREKLAMTMHAREKTLWEKQISSEQDFLDAQQAWAEVRIERRSAEQKFRALGLPGAMAEMLDDESDETITQYEIRSPMDGIVVEKHIALGESLDANSDIFTIVDMDSVWVNLTVYIKHLAAIHKGQTVVLRSDHSGVQVRGEVVMITPFAEESTRSATARVILDNRDARWMPGTFVTGFVSTSEDSLLVVIPRNALQQIEGSDVVFVEHEDGFEATSVTTGRTDREHVEILAGLAPGTPYVAAGAFELKATVVTRNLGSHAGHGH